MADYPLVYLFEAEFRDGFILRQTPDDVSRTNPLKSAFYDVLNYPSGLAKFSLVGKGETWTVHLEPPPYFSVNNSRIIEPKEDVKNVRVIYYRQVDRSYGGVGHGELRVGYYIGWQGNCADGRNVIVVKEVGSWKK
jgi:hypothetical protein